jgi:tRNA threonylcarbamoyladenosine biosynthesis protein TsaB
MIILLDTSTPVCRLRLVNESQQMDYEWQADRQLAHYLLGWLKDRLSDQGKTWNDISGIGVFRGPGSFTGLRIGLTVMNTLADSLHIPIVGTMNKNWQDNALQQLRNGNDDQIVLPYYDHDANITTAKK